MTIELASLVLTGVGTVATVLGGTVGIFALFMRRIDLQFARIDGQFARVYAQFERIDARFERIDARFERIDARFDKIDARFEKVDEQFAEVRRELNANTVAIARLEGPPPRLMLGPR